MRATVPPRTFTCDACAAERKDSYYELSRHGWSAHSEGSARILLCPACTAFYAIVWAKNKEEAA